MLRIGSIIFAAAALVFCADLAEIRSIMVNRVDEGKKAVGIVVGTIDENGRQVIGHGRTVAGGTKEPDGDTLFEIGSITKVFTSLVLADMIERGEVKPDDPVKKFLPSTVTVPSRNGKEITLLDLSMQISGLPRMPNNFRPKDLANPYVDYDPPKLYEFLSGYTLTRDIGEKYEYSNVGVGLLGHALSLKAGMSYEDMIRRRILDPLGMKSTTVKLSPELEKRMATGHDAQLHPVKNWDLDALAGAGAIRSTANDMLKFLAANLELTDSPLKAAMRRMRSVHRETGATDLEIMMAWHVLHKNGADLVWHNGGTAGFRTFAGFVPEKKTGVVVLCNTNLDCDDIGRHTLDGQYPVTKFSPPVVRKEVTLNPKILDSYVGEYQLRPDVTIKVTHTGGQMFIQLTGQPAFEMFAEKEGEFFLKVVDAQLSFAKDGLVLHQNGIDQHAKKI